MRELHSFQSVEIHDVPSDTKDKDEFMESEFFDSRQAFLIWCQGNHYQYDTFVHDGASPFAQPNSSCICGML
ncbi:histone acetyltransferase HAC1-like [Physcomitrium patens]